MNKIMNSYIMAPNGLCYAEHSIWFIQCNSNKLVRVDENTYDVINVINLDEDLFYDDRGSWDRIIKVQDKLIIFLYGKEYLYYYNLSTGELEKKTELMKGYPMKANAVIEYDSKIFLLPCWDVPLIVIDVLAERSEVYFEEMKNKPHMSWGIDIDDEENIVYATDRRNNAVYSIGLDDKTIQSTKIGDLNTIYFGVKKVQKYYILPHMDVIGITIFDSEKNAIYKIEKFPEGFLTGAIPIYGRFCEVGNKILLLPQNSNMFLMIDVEKKEVFRLFENYQFHNNKGSRMVRETFLDYLIHENKIITYDLLKKSWVIFDSCQNRFRIIKKGDMRLLDNVFDEDIKKEKNKCGVFRESYLCTLEGYIELIS